MPLSYQDKFDINKVLQHYKDSWETRPERSAYDMDNGYWNDRCISTGYGRKAPIPITLITFAKVCGFFYQKLNENVCEAFEELQSQPSLQGIARNTAYGACYLLNQPIRKVLPTYTYVTVESIIDEHVRHQLARRILNQPETTNVSTAMLEVLKPLTIIFDSWTIEPDESIESSLPPHNCKIVREGDPLTVRIVPLRDNGLPL